ncbi:hypothetical protein ACP70R_015706 [Stipagrostis hirtigluma subsp. patula]
MWAEVDGSIEARFLAGRQRPGRRAKAIRCKYTRSFTGAT